MHVQMCIDIIMAGLINIIPVHPLFLVTPLTYTFYAATIPLTIPSKIGIDG